jgi:hypothetical protein
LISGPSSIRLGDTAHFRILLDGTTPAALDVFHIEVADPSGNVVPNYGTTLLAPARVSSYTLPLALNDTPGEWEIRVQDLLTGATAAERFEARP